MVSEIGGLIIFSLIMIVISLVFAIKNLIEGDDLWQKIGLFVFILAYIGIAYLLLWLVLPEDILLNQNDFQIIPENDVPFIYLIILSYFFFGFMSTDTDILF
jgi:hypothetical protein